MYAKSPTCADCRFLLRIQCITLTDARANRFAKGDCIIMWKLIDVVLITETSNMVYNHQCSKLQNIFGCKHKQKTHFRMSEYQ